MLGPYPTVHWDGTRSRHSRITRFGKYLLFSFVQFKRENGRGFFGEKKKKISHDLFWCKIASSIEE